MTGGALLPVLHGMSEVRSWAESWDDCLILSPSCLARAGYVAGDVGLQQGLDVGFSDGPSPRCGLPGRPLRPACPSLVCQMVGAR